MIYRTMEICSTYKALDVEFIEIRDRAVENGYPIAVVESVIRSQLGLRHTPREVQPTPLQIDTIVLRVPYMAFPVKHVITMLPLRPQNFIHWNECASFMM